jgi:ketosteroid isomerase-like protein
MGRFDGSVQLELHDVVANDEHAVALQRATGSRKGKEYDALEIDIFHIRDGEVTEFWSFSEDQRLTDEFWS